MYQFVSFSHQLFEMDTDVTLTLHKRRKAVPRAEPPAFGPVLWSTSVSGLTEAVSLPLTSASLAPPQGDNHPYALCLNFFFKVLWPGIGLDLLSIRQSIYISYLFSLRQLWEAEHSDVKRQHYRAAGAKSKCERFRARGGEGGSQEKKDQHHRARHT